jgi:hypothetical protein
VYGRRAMRDDRFELVGDAQVLERWLECSAL